jgi:hypothetical protein
MEYKLENIITTHCRKTQTNRLGLINVLHIHPTGLHTLTKVQQGFDSHVTSATVRD